MANTDAGMVATVGRTVGAAGLATTSLVLPESRPSAPGRSIVSGVPADVTARATGATAGVVPAADEAMLITALGNPAAAASAGSLIRSTGMATIGFLRTSGRR